MFYYVCRVDSLSLCFTKKNERSTGPSPTPPGRCHCMDGELASTVEVGSVICPLCYVSSSPVHKYLRNQKAFNNSINIIFMKILSIDILNVFWPISSEIQTRKARGQAHPLRWPTKTRIVPTCPKHESLPVAPFQDASAGSLAAGQQSWKACNKCNRKSWPNPWDVLIPRCQMEQAAFRGASHIPLPDLHLCTSLGRVLGSHQKKHGSRFGSISHWAHQLKDDAMSRGPTCSASCSTKSSPAQGIADIMAIGSNITKWPATNITSCRCYNHPLASGKWGKKRHAAGPGNGRNRSVSEGNVCGSSDKGGLLRWDQMEGALQVKRCKAWKTPCNQQGVCLPSYIAPLQKYHSTLPSCTGQSFPVEKGGIHLWGCDLCQALSRWLCTLGGGWLVANHVGGWRKYR